MTRPISVRPYRSSAFGAGLAATIALAAAFGPGSGQAAEQTAPGAGAGDAGGDIPNLVGTWSGENRTISDLKGLRSWTKTIHITEQTDRRFRGYFTYSAGTKHFFGVIYPDNETMTWVASDSKGYNHGRLMGSDRLGACYVEPGAEATAGCADMRRVSTTPEPAPAKE